MTNKPNLAPTGPKAVVAITENGDDLKAAIYAMTRFSESVDKLTRILGMQAENDQRKACGHSMAYVEDDFLDA
jgi:Mn-dependent DtxR family transcriptional regulator